MVARPTLIACKSAATKSGGCSRTPPWLLADMLSDRGARYVTFGFDNPLSPFVALGRSEDRHQQRHARQLVRWDSIPGSPLAYGSVTPVAPHAQRDRHHQRRADLGGRDGTAAAKLRDNASAIRRLACSNGSTVRRCRRSRRGRTRQIVRPRHRARQLIQVAVRAVAWRRRPYHPTDRQHHRHAGPGHSHSPTDPARQRRPSAQAAGRSTTESYCGCGSPCSLAPFRVIRLAHGQRGAERDRVC